jgi:hypothetical protein
LFHPVSHVSRQHPAVARIAEHCRKHDDAHDNPNGQKYIYRDPQPPIYAHLAYHPSKPILRTAGSDSPDAVRDLLRVEPLSVRHLASIFGTAGCRPNYNPNDETGSRQGAAQVAAMGVDCWNTHYRVASLVFASWATAPDGGEGHYLSICYLTAAYSSDDVMGRFQNVAAGWERVSLANLDIFFWMRRAVFGPVDPLDRLFFSMLLRLDWLQLAPRCLASSLVSLLAGIFGARSVRFPLIFGGLIMGGLVAIIPIGIL